MSREIELDLVQLSFPPRTNGGSRSRGLLDQFAGAASEEDVTF